MRYIKVEDLEEKIVEAIKAAMIMKTDEQDFTAGYIDGLDHAHEMLLYMFDNNYVDITILDKQITITFETGGKDELQSL